MSVHTYYMFILSHDLINIWQLLYTEKLDFPDEYLLLSWNPGRYAEYKKLIQKSRRKILQQFYYFIFKFTVFNFDASRITINYLGH